MADTVRANIPADFVLPKGDIVKIVADTSSNGKALGIVWPRHEYGHHVLS